MQRVDNVPAAIRIALELDFTLADIKLCYRHGMNSAALVDRLCDFESERVTLESTHLKDSARQRLEEETLSLYFKEMCVMCRVNKRNQVALPCSHYLVCDNCTMPTCYMCEMKVTNYIHVFRC